MSLPTPYELFNHPKYASLVRYLVSGGSAFAAEYVSFLLLYAVLSAQLYVANTLSFCLGLAISFTLNRVWTFREGNYKRAARHQFAMYAVLAACNVVLTNVIIGLLDRAGLDPRLGKIACMFFIVCWNFFIFRYVIFANHSEDRKDI